MKLKEREQYEGLVRKLSRELHSNAYLDGDKDAEGRVKVLRDQLSQMEGVTGTPREEIRARAQDAPKPAAAPAAPAPVAKK